MKYMERTITLETGKVRAMDSQGSKMPIVFLHGAGFSRKIFHTQVDSFLADRYRLITVDLPGHGRSDRLPTNMYTVPAVARIVKQALDQMDIGRYALVGWCIGGNIAIELASICRRVSGLFLTGCVPVRPGLLSSMGAMKISADAVLILKKELPNGLFERYIKLNTGMTDNAAILQWAREADTAARPELVRSLIRGLGINQRQFIEDTELPVCFVNGAGDHFVRPEFFDTLSVRRLYPGRAVRIPKGGHAPFLTHPADFNDILDSFVSDAIIKRNA